MRLLTCGCRVSALTQSTLCNGHKPQEVEEHLYTAVAEVQVPIFVSLAIGVSLKKAPEFLEESRINRIRCPGVNGRLILGAPLASIGFSLGCTATRAWAVDIDRYS